MTAVLIIIFLGIVAWAMNSPIKKQEIIEEKRRIQALRRQEVDDEGWRVLYEDSLKSKSELDDD